VTPVDGVHRDGDVDGMDLRKRLSLSFIAILLILIALLVAVRAWAPTFRPEGPSTAGALAPNLLSGVVTGLDPGDGVQLHLEQLVGGEVDGRGEIVHRFDIANGRWQQPGLALPPGRYRLIPEAKDYVHIPHSIVFQVPEEGVAWRYTRLDFEFLHPKDALARFGLPLCDELAPHVPVTAVPEGTPDPGDVHGAVQPGPPASTAGMCYANHLADTWLVPAGLQGQISGLPAGGMATVTLFALPPVAGEGYGQGEPPSPGSSYVYPPEVASLAEVPEIAPGWLLTATLVTGNGTWGLVDPALAGGRYLVVAQADGQAVTPPAYEVVIFSGKAPGFPGGVDFAFGPEPQASPAEQAQAARQAPSDPPAPRTTP